MSEIPLIVGVQNDSFDQRIRLTWPATINSERHIIIVQTGKKKKGHTHSMMISNKSNSESIASFE